MFPEDTKILIVDDFATMRKIIRKVLSELSYKNVEETDDGNTALPKLETAADSNQPFGLIISDWNMPGMTGIDLLKAVRANDKLKDAGFLMVTSESEQKNVVAAVQAGVDDYVVKPFNGVTLSQKLENVYKRKNARAPA